MSAFAQLSSEVVLKILDYACNDCRELDFARTGLGATLFRLFAAEQFTDILAICPNFSAACRARSPFMIKYHTRDERSRNMCDLRRGVGILCQDNDCLPVVAYLAGEFRACDVALREMVKAAAGSGNGLAARFVIAHGKNNDECVSLRLAAVLVALDADNHELAKEITEL